MVSFSYESQGGTECPRHCVLQDLVSFDSLSSIVKFASLFPFQPVSFPSFEPYDMSSPVFKASRNCMSDEDVEIVTVRWRTLGDNCND